jgi:hypothetical protein
MNRELMQLRADVEQIRRQLAAMQGRQRTLRGTVRTIRQVAHGFTVGTVVRISGANTYAKAQADTAANAQAVGVVGAIVSPDAFMLYGTGCKVSGLTGLTAGQRSYLSDSTAGAASTVSPAISVPVWDAVTSSDAFVLPSQGAAASSLISVTGNADLTTVTNSTWSAGRKLVTFIVVGGGGGGGGAGSAASATNFYATGGGGSSGKIRLFQFIMEDGYTLEITAGAGGSGGSAELNGGTGNTTTLVIKNSGGTALITVTAGGGGGGGGALSGNVCRPGYGGVTPGGQNGEPGMFVRFTPGFSNNTVSSAGGEVPFITATTGRGGTGGNHTSTSGSSGVAGGAFYA